MKPGSAADLTTGASTFGGAVAIVESGVSDGDGGETLAVDRELLLDSLHLFTGADAVSHCQACLHK